MIVKSMVLVLNEYIYLHLVNIWQILFKQTFTKIYYIFSQCSAGKNKPNNVESFT